MNLREHLRVVRFCVRIAGKHNRVSSVHFTPGRVVSDTAVIDGEHRRVAAQRFVFLERLKGEQSQ